MMYDSDAVLQDAYDTSHGAPFAIPMLDRYIVFVADPQQAKRLEHSNPPSLSEMEALHELASTNLLLGDVKSSSEKCFKDGIGALKTRLRLSLPALSRDIQVRVEQALNIELKRADVCQIYELGHSTEWKRIRLAPALLRMITRVNLPIFVGDEHGNKPEVFENLMCFFWTCLSTLVIITFLPGFLVPLVGPLFTRWGLSKRKLYNTVLSLARSSVSADESGSQKPAHLVQWVAERIKTRDATEVAKTSVGLVFSSAFQIPIITQAILYYLCTYPQYLPRLREEALKHQCQSLSSIEGEMPHMNSFIKETARLSPGLILSVPRRVMSTYMSPDGVVVPTGNWIAIPQYPLMRDPGLWPGGSAFSGCRFVDAQGKSSSHFTHPSLQFPYWGSVRHACPGRFYASAIVKIILMRFLCHYEFRLEKPRARLFSCFGIIRLTNPFMTLLVRERNDSGKGDL